jgi:NhaP-type Na+/H+ or K+/H+ antiporter
LFQRQKERKLTLIQFELIGWNELIACFFCGVAMDWDGELHEDDLHSHFSEGIDAILDVSVFTTLGTVLPWSVWLNPDPPVSIARLVGFSIGILALRRIPAVLAVARWVPEIRTMREAIFVGWFGPMGIGAIYYALKACELVRPDAVGQADLL